MEKKMETRLWDAASQAALTPPNPNPSLPSPVTTRKDLGLAPPPSLTPTLARPPARPAPDALSRQLRGELLGNHSGTTREPLGNHSGQTLIKPPPHPNTKLVFGWGGGLVKVCPEWFPSGSRVVPEWFPSGCRVVPEWFPSGSRKFVPKARLGPRPQGPGSQDLSQLPRGEGRAPPQNL